MAEETGREQIEQKSYRPVLIQGVQIILWRNDFTKKKNRAGKDQIDPRILKAVSAVLNRQRTDSADVTVQPDSDEWSCRRMEKGKPYFVHHPGIHFSLSDSEDLTAVAFAPEAAGLDIQLHRRHSIRRSERDEQDRLRKMARRFYHPDERDFVLNGIEGIPQRFYRIWTAKEAYVKYTGQGIDGQFAKLSVIPENLNTLPVQMSGTSRPEQPVIWRALNCRFYYAEPEEGLSLCLCTEADLPVSMRFIE